MMAPRTFVVTVVTPDGEERVIELPEEQVLFFTREQGNEYRTALFLASADDMFKESIGAEPYGDL
jgi:hypothetical protein